LLTESLASALARVAAANVQREYPRRADQLLSSAGDLALPGKLHPAFYGSYDWHSAVHMHWTLARLLRLFPILKSEIAPVLDRHLSKSSIDTELAFFRRTATFERPYGWAWLLALQAELLQTGKWSVAPLAEELARRMAEYVTASPYPVRAGAHGNTAFAGILALDYARSVNDKRLEESITKAALRWYGGDHDAPVNYEPSADDFLSPTLVEAVLMREVGAGDDWLKGFLPAGLGPLARPPRVTDHADAKQSHLDGLCLSRAWCFSRLGFHQEARIHVAAGMPHVVGGDYVGEHWLASFALLALGDRP
jgi:Protein of unknown function (DUF2891)